LALEAPTTTTLPPTTTTTAIPTTTLPPTTSTTTTTKGTLVIHGTGDVAVDPWYIPTLKAKGWDHAWSGLDGLFINDDLTVVNLECVPSDLGKALDKAFTFRCPTEALPSIRANGVEVANMGNNHSGDFGKDALVDGRAQLIAADIAPVGAGRDIVEAGEPAIFEIEGWTVAVVGFGGVAPSPNWYAAEDRAGMRSGDHIDQMVEAVAAADAVADIVVVTIHWGWELETYPRQEDIDRAEAMVEAGADIIFGHHQHRLNPLETVDGAAVFWGLGNFVWPHNSVPSATTAVARVVVSPDGSIEACMIPAYIETHGHPVLTGEPECGPGL
jgi:poly-gamma-glutamate synthesis protein (capsule biosynthesis protein)